MNGEQAASILTDKLGYEIEADELIETTETMANFISSNGDPTDRAGNYAAWESLRDAKRRIELFVIDGGDIRFAHTR